MGEPRANGHYFDSGSSMYYLVRGNQVSMYSVDSNPRSGTISTERKLIMSVNADTGNVHWAFGTDRNDAFGLAQKVVETVKAANFSNPYNTTQDFYSYVSFSPAQWQALRGYQDTIMDLTTHPEHPAPIYVPKPQQKMEVAPASPASPVAPGPTPSGGYTGPRGPDGRPLVRPNTRE